MRDPSRQPEPQDGDRDDGGKRLRSRSGYSPATFEFDVLEASGLTLRVIVQFPCTDLVEWA